MKFLILVINVCIQYNVIQIPDFVVYVFLHSMSQIHEGMVQYIFHKL